MVQVVGFGTARRVRWYGRDRTAAVDVRRRWGLMAADPQQSDRAGVTTRPMSGLSASYIGFCLYRLSWRDMKCCA